MMRDVSVEPARPGSVIFARMSSYYVNIETRPGCLLKLLRDRSGALGIVDENSPIVSIDIRHCAARILASILLKYAVANVKRVLGVKAGLVSLPNHGHVAIYCFPGYMRIFDLERSTVTSICHSLPADARRRLEQVVDSQARLSTLGVAPRILDKEENLSGYVEEYCTGTPLRAYEWWRKEVFDEICAKVKSIQRSQVEQVVPGGAPAVELAALVDIRSDHVRKAGEELHAWLEDAIAETVELADRTDDLRLFMSHGDLARRNVLVRSGGGLVFIDWQTLGYRVKDYDLYNYYFSIIQDGDAARIDTHRIFADLSDALELSDRETASRRLWQFRLCFLATRIKYFVARSWSDPTRLTRVLEQIRDYYGIFDQYHAFCETTLPSVASGSG